MVQCSDLVRPHPGETEKVLQDIFKKAKEHAEEGKTMLFLENVDLIGKQILKYITIRIRYNLKYILSNIRKRKKSSNFESITKFAGSE